MGETSVLNSCTCIDRLLTPCSLHLANIAHIALLPAAARVSSFSLTTPTRHSTVQPPIERPSPAALQCPIPLAVAQQCLFTRQNSLFDAGTTAASARPATGTAGTAPICASASSTAAGPLAKCQIPNTKVGPQAHPLRRQTRLMGSHNSQGVPIQPTNARPQQVLRMLSLRR
ncbi:hypothetical protein COO60DRAFT_808233 [Scenedesmus sp. NREL 46B-D3]|nr:hypothetical protein COO60DRAFT_808233 [Scenedesmus sp. NREL 46B-D3]